MTERSTSFLVSVKVVAFQNYTWPQRYKNGKAFDTLMGYVIFVGHHRTPMGPIPYLVGNIVLHCN